MLTENMLWLKLNAYGKIKNRYCDNFLMRCIEKYKDYSPTEKTLIKI
jgi:hypothetical protein